MNKVMKLDDDFWLQLMISLGFGTLGGFAKYLNYRNQQRKNNPKFNEKFFSALLVSTLCLSGIAAMTIVFLILEVMPHTSPKMIVVYSVLAGIGGFAGLQIFWQMVVRQIAHKHYGVEIKQVEIDDLMPTQPEHKPTPKKKPTR